MEGGDATMGSATARAGDVERQVLEDLIDQSGEGSTRISSFVSSMIARGYTRERAVAHLHRQVDEGNVAFDSLFHIVRR